MKNISFPPPGIKVAGNQAFVGLFNDLLITDEEKRYEWKKWLKEGGIKAAHPNDGWHERENKKIILTYPYFNEGINVGDQVALGDFDEFKVVTVKKIGKGILSQQKHYFY